MSEKGTITVRPPKKSDLKNRLIKYSERMERSMNYIAVKAIEEYLKKSKPK
jgi:predicted transcriptional regulator